MSKKINLALIKIISEIPELSGSTANKIYPIKTNNSVEMPYVILVRDGVNTEYTKDAFGFKNVNSFVGVFAKTYKESVEIADIITDELIKFRGTIEGININQIREGDDEETFEKDKDGNEGYLQSMVFNIKTT
ncbi:hypothetical protein E9993_01625 [Labilibacter sediminis]|nr:hypothetical protein E9993_01625 [Labilibacter sediminis]